jgi:hypothetical protein
MLKSAFSYREIVTMAKQFRATLLCVAAFASPMAARAEPAPFACRLLETTAPLPELSTYSGYRWIECRVVGPEIADVAGVSVNKGKCETFDYWYAGRRFVRGEAINIPYACLSPVTVAIQANGAIWTMKLR